MIKAFSTASGHLSAVAQLTASGRELHLNQLIIDN